MRLLNLTLPTPEENLALDEALLDEAEQTGDADGVLRLWEPKRPMVVMGRASKVELEVHLAECVQRDIPVLRRSSGGASIITGPGCLMYAVVLSYERYPALRMLDQAHRFVLERVAAALDALLPEAARQGTSDLTVGDKKFSGNSLRCKRTHLLYHGTLLYDFPLELIGACLKSPPRQPDYRHRRAHDEFVMNLPLTRGALERALIASWQADEPAEAWPRQRVRELVATKYERVEW
jgi:lipoate-protein ligase A